MLAASRGLGILSLSWKLGCKQKLSVVGRIHPATIKELPRHKPQRGHPPLNTCLPRQFALNCALSDSSFSSSQDDPVILSSKECPDGSILFVFGSPGHQVSEELTADAGKISESDNDGICDAHIRHNGSTTKEAKIDDKGTEVISVEDTKLEEQLESLSIKGSTSKASPEEVQTTDASGLIEAESLDSRKSANEQGMLRLRTGGAIRPHPTKEKTGGEDAYLIEGDSWAGVADGVGGWAMSGIDSGLYSRELMKNCGLLANSENGIPNPKSVIIKGVNRTKAIGSCTAVLAALHKQTLYVANIGDSGFIVVRDGMVLAKSKPMQHGFNFPHQIGSEGDDPATAETFEVNVASGDVLVLATDGVYDNLYEREIVDIVNSGQKKGIEPGTVAMWLVKLAHEAGLNTKGRSPFSDAAHAAGYSYEGGKLDDATVVVSYVENDDPWLD
ncbi:hypothetical protein GOP47_0008868 [Adiantum capillus-veneris]|uniref:Protein phosphatase n=1 Tax=Adiantum capillus-veneris TaxID=13818 RepID=A0A9D4V033_ADICA|nr:hypothetical protein GOP47_0008868 [Adiantum capillus-veneris]